MNAEQARANAAIMLAYAEGKTIECRSYSSGPDGKWYTTIDPDFMFSHYEYRIKPEPRTFYALEDAKNPGSLFCMGPLKEEAERYQRMYSKSGQIKIVELVEKL